MRIFKLCQYVSVLPLAVLMLVPFACAQEHLIAPPIVTRYCSGCHGMDGNSQLSYIPRLAGQNAAYLEGKLASFRGAGPVPVDEAFARIAHAGSSRKDTPVTNAATVHMVGTASAVSAEEIKAAAEWFAVQQPAHGRSGKGKVNEEGKSLFANGLQSQGLAACQTCHGPEAQGTGTAPRLAGQNAEYLIDQLARFRASALNSSPMADVARRVGGDQARALAAYLQAR